MVSSAGVDPWVEIEERAQRKILLSSLDDDIEVVWVEASSAASKRVVARVLNSLIYLQMWLKLPSSRGPRLHSMRAVIADVPDLFHRNALGSGLQTLYCRKLLSGSPPARMGNRFRLNMPHGYGFTGRRTIESFRLALENYQFDFMLRLTSTCLVNPIVLDKLIEKLPSKRVYAGQLLKFRKVAYNSGSSLLLSRDVVESVVANSSDFLVNIAEDVAIGEIIVRLSLGDFHEMNRADISSLKLLEMIPKSKIMQVPILRCKAESGRTTMAQPVIEIMEGISNRFGEAWRA